MQAAGTKDAVILNYSQTPVIYREVPKIWLTHADSTEDEVKLIPFTYGEAVSKTVDPNFSLGDMVVPIKDGELITELTITKPPNLSPEIIKLGEVVCGIEGKYAGASLEVNLSDQNLAYFAYQLDFAAKETAVYEILYDKLQTASGSCNINVITVRYWSAPKGERL